MTDVGFSAPVFVHLLWPLLGVAALLWWLDGRFERALDALVGSTLGARLVVNVSRGRRRARIVLLTLACAALVVALMRPYSGTVTVTSSGTGAEIIVALDVSRSMLAEDVAPNRLERAKADIRDLLKRLSGDRVGLIAFAGRATVMVPLTADLTHVGRVLDDAHPGVTGRGGTRLEEPIRRAASGFGRTGDAARTLLLITDGEDLDSFPREAARDAAEQGVRIIAIGIGDENGAPIVVSDPLTGAPTELRDAAGNTVISRLDGALLRELAALTDGVYIPAETGVLDLDAIHAAHIAPLLRGQLDEQRHVVPNEVYQWPVAMALLLVLAAAAVTAGTPRGLSALAVIGVVSMSPHADGLAATDSPDTVEAAADTPLWPDDARAAYNLAVKALADDRFDDAIAAFNHARERAGQDAEVRFAATFNLGASEADQGLAARDDGRLEDAVAALERAAYWFGEALELRRDDGPSRENLERTRLLALQLADGLREPGSTALPARIGQVQARLRKLMGALAGTSARSAGPAARASEDERRRAREELRTLATDALAIVADTQGILADAADEVASLDPDAEGEDAVRRQTLEQAIVHLHGAGGRLAQMRGRLRRGQGVAAYRRADRARGALARAAGIFLAPAQRLAALSDDTARQVALARLADGPRPAWLSGDLLSDRVDDLAGRAGELVTLFASSSGEIGAGNTLNADGASDTRFEEALPPLTRARDALREARDRRAEGDSAEASGHELDALAELERAREAFLELRALVERAHAQGRGVVNGLESAAASDAVATVHAGNVERLERIAARLAEERNAEDETARARAEQAAPILAAARGEAAALAQALQAPSPDRDRATTTARTLHARLGELRRLFFTLIEHLREVHRRQGTLGEQTAVLAERAAAGDRAGLEAETGAAGVEQSDLTMRAGAIAEALQARAEETQAAARAGSSPGGPAPTGPTPDDLRQAGSLVGEAGFAMDSAHAGLGASPPDYKQAVNQQSLAFAKLDQALRILEPPTEGESGQNNPSQGGDAGGQGSDESAAERSAADERERLMQGIRDRDARRRAERSDTPAGTIAVEQDW